MQNPIEQFFRDEFENNIDQISIALQKIDANGSFDSQIQIIMKGCMHIMDLGMVHGYDGVEAIAGRMFTAARSCAVNGASVLEKSKKRLNDAMQTLRQVVELGEDSSAQPYIDATNSNMDFQIDDFEKIDEATELEAEEGESEAQDLDTKQKPEAKLFEIKEFTAVPKIREKATSDENQDKSNDADEQLEPVFEKEKEYWLTESFADELQDEDEEDIEVIKNTLEDINLQKAVYDLDQINSAIEIIKDDGEDANLAIQDIKDSCADLRVISEEEAMQPIAEIIYPMERIAAEKLKGNNSEIAVDIMEECTALLRDFLFNHELPLTKLTSIRTSFNTKLFADSRVSPFEEFDIDEVHEFEDELGEVHLIKTPLVSKLRKLFGMY
ncbi:hypothetical protein KC799_23875 [candidate division KSB1 bacterium]|nr:hypothetical protein [candidate division KSB1 bacterium]